MEGAPNCSPSVAMNRRGLGIAGLVNAADGVLVMSANLNWPSLPFLDRWQSRFNLPVHVGNEASIDLVDVLEYLAEDAQTKAIGMYIECIRRPDRFLDAARRIMLDGASLSDVSTEIAILLGIVEYVRRLRSTETAGTPAATRAGGRGG